MADKRDAPAVYVAIRRQVASADKRLTPGGIQPASHNSDSATGRVDLSGVGELVINLIHGLGVLPADDIRLGLVRSLEAMAETLSDTSTAQEVVSASSWMRAYAAQLPRYLLSVTTLDFARKIESTFMSLMRSLHVSAKRGARRRGGAGSRRRPSFESVNVSSRILSLEYQDNERKTDVLTLSVENFDLTQFDEPLFKRGDTIEYSFGYYHRMAPIREAVVRKVTGGTVLTIEAHSKDVLMDQVKRRKSYTNKTRSEVAREVAFRNGYTEESIHIEDTVEVYEVITQPNLTDAQFLRKLGNRQGCEFFVDYDGFHWHTRNVGQRPIHKWVYYTSGVGDILGFNVENDLTRKPSRVRVRGVNPVTGEAFEAVADDNSDSDRDALQPEIGVKHPVWVPDALADALVFSEVEENEQPAVNQHDVSERAVDTKEQAVVEAKKIFRKATQRAVKMQMTLVGDASIVGKSVVKVEGMGKRLSGRYYIKNIRHTITGGGTYTMSADLITDGYGSSRKRGSNSGRDQTLDISGLIAQIVACARRLPEPYGNIVEQKARQGESIIISKDGFNGNGYKPAARAFDQINSLVLPPYTPSSSSQVALKNKIMNLVAKLVALCVQASYNNTESSETEARVNNKEPEGEGLAWVLGDDALRYMIGTGSA